MTPAELEKLTNDELLEEIRKCKFRSQRMGVAVFETVKYPPRRGRTRKLLQLYSPPQNAHKSERTRVSTPEEANAELTRRKLLQPCHEAWAAAMLEAVRRGIPQEVLMDV